MAIVERILEWLGGVDKAQVEKRAYEAYQAGYNDGGEDEPISGSTARYGYRRSTTAGLRDFSQIDHDQMLNIVWTLWQSNPIAKRALIIKRDYIIGSGVQFQADDDQLADMLAEFWSRNELDKRLKEFALQLFLFGEQCYPAFVRLTDGQVRLGYIDPADIEEVITNPENALEMWAVVIKPQEQVKEWQSRQAKRVYRIVRKESTVYGAELLLNADQAQWETWESTMLGAYGLDAYTGSCFYYKVNSVSNQPRGYSDLLQVADWLDQHDETLFALADREQMAGYFSWDVTLTGANEDSISKRAKQLRAAPPKKGSVNVHNEAEAWQFNYPELKQTASIETGNALLTFVLGGLGLPRHWYGYGDETNRATAQAQGDPTWRSLSHDQGVIQGMLLDLLKFARDQAQLAGAWQPTFDPEIGAETGAITVSMPEMTAKDLTSISAAAGQLATALMAAGEQGWITRQTAAEAWAKLLAEFGIKIDVNKELASVDAEQAQNATGQAQASNDWLMQHGVLVQSAGGLEPGSGSEEAPAAFPFSQSREWAEEEHPRDDTGKFASKGSSGSDSSTPSSRPKRRVRQKPYRPGADGENWEVGTKVVNGVYVDDQHRTHWRRKHQEVTPEAEKTALVKALEQPQKTVTSQREVGTTLQYAQDKEGYWWVAVVKRPEGRKPVLTTFHGTGNPFEKRKRKRAKK